MVWRKPERCGIDAVNFVENARWLMESRGISRRDMAKLLHTSAAYVSMILNYRMAPAITRPEQVAKLHGVTVGELVGPHGEFQERYAPWNAGTGALTKR